MASEFALPVWQNGETVLRNALAAPAGPECRANPLGRQSESHPGDRLSRFPPSVRPRRRHSESGSAIEISYLLSASEFALPVWQNGETVLRNAPAAPAGRECRANPLGRQWKSEKFAVKLVPSIVEREKCDATLGDSSPSPGFLGVG